MKKGTTIKDLHVLHRRGIELYQLGWKKIRIAEALGVQPSTVTGWVKKFEEQGNSSLEYPKMGGSVRQISEEQMRLLRDHLVKGAATYGFAEDFWTAKRVARVIEEQFGIVYQERNVYNILHHMGFSLQKPVLRNDKKDAQAVANWYTDRLPAIKKKHAKKTT